MRVEAYRCDFCGQIWPESHIVGVIPREDLFERLESFPIEPQPHKTNVHHCLKCYENVVLSQTRLIDRRKDEHLYAGKLKELQFLLRSQCVKNVIQGKKFPRLE